MPLKRDSKLGKYIIRAQIGEGGMGVVYKARDSVLGREVAIKTILAHRATDRDFLSRFRREAFAISRMDHPHIVKLLDFVEANPETDEPAFMVMEFLPGHDLASVIAKKGPLAIQRGVDRIVQACAAVSACHRLGYVHRDLKPNNIFLAEYDQIETTKVLDFGAAKAEDRPEGQGGDELSELTKKGTYIGTFFYMSPEVIDRGPVTPAADQYALAVVLYQALAGLRPFDHDKNKEFREVELLQTIVKGQYKPLREHRSEVPEGLAAVIKKGMEVKPSNRYFDLHAFGGALLRWASPQIRLMWEKHFTSSAPAKIDPKMSIAILAPADREMSANDATNIDLTVPPLEGPHNTSPTVQGGRDPMLTIPLGTKELRLAGASVATTAVQDPNNPPSISIEFHDPAAAPAAEPSNTPLNTTTPRPAGGALRRPAVILTAAASALGVVLAVSIVLSRAKPASPKTPAPAPELFARPAVPPAAPSPPPVAPPVAPIPAAPPAALPSAAPAAAAALPENPPITEKKRTAHKHHKPQIVDKNGIAIPSD